MPCPFQAEVHLFQAQSSKALIDFGFSWVCRVKNSEKALLLNLVHLVVMFIVFFWHIIVLTQNYNFSDAIQCVPKNCFTPLSTKQIPFACQGKIPFIRLWGKCVIGQFWKQSHGERTGTYIVGWLDWGEWIYWLDRGGGYKIRKLEVGSHVKQQTEYNWNHNYHKISQEKDKKGTAMEGKINFVAKLSELLSPSHFFHSLTPGSAFAYSLKHLLIETTLHTKNYIFLSLYQILTRKA